MLIFYLTPPVQEKSRLALLSADVERVSKENAALLQELAAAKASAARSVPSASPAEVPRAHVQIVTAAPSREQVRANAYHIYPLVA